MSANKISVPVVTYCVPAHDVQTVADYEPFDYLSPDNFYPSASAEYFSDPTEDPDFCDIIADLAQDEHFDYSWGPSAVALPVANADQGTVSAVSIAVPEGYVSSYDEKGIVIPANAVNAVEDVDFKMKFLGWEDGIEDINEQTIVLKKKVYDQKLRRSHAVQRLKEKRALKKNKHVAKSLGPSSVPSSSPSFSSHSSSRADTSSTVTGRKIHPATTNITATGTTAVVVVVTARQAAAAHRERVNGKFKHNKTRWVTVTELMRQTHLRDHQQGAGGGGNHSQVLGTADKSSERSPIPDGLTFTDGSRPSLLMAGAPKMGPPGLSWAHMS